MTLQRFEYDQNNSGGGFVTPEWTGPEDRGGVFKASYSEELNNVYVMAEDVDEANYLAKNYAGVYFNGCRTGMDCKCCGDRWYPPFGPVEADDE